MGMTDKQFYTMQNNLLNAMKRFPNCKIASCGCNSKEGERIGNCSCLCHIKEIKKDMEKKKGTKKPNGWRRWLLSRLERNKRRG